MPSHPQEGTHPPAAPSLHAGPSPNGREIPHLFHWEEAGKAAYLFKPSFEVSFVSK